MPRKPTVKQRRELLTQCKNIQPPERMNDGEFEKMSKEEREKWSLELEAWMKSSHFLQRIFEYPLIVNKIAVKQSRPVQSQPGPGNPSRVKSGDLAQVRSCREEHGDKTRLGICIGYVPIGFEVKLDAKTRGMDKQGRDVGDLLIEPSRLNPAFFVFELNDVICGFESWWQTIKSPEDLKQITDADIQNVPYLKAILREREATSQQAGVPKQQEKTE